MLFDDDDEFLETELCSAESLHYAWPNFLLLNSRNALVSCAETSEISIWGECCCQQASRRESLTLTLFSKLTLRRAFSEAPESLAVLWIPRQLYLCASRESRRRRAAELGGPTPKVHRKEKQNPALAAFSPELTQNELMAPNRDSNGV